MSAVVTWTPLLEVGAPEVVAMFPPDTVLTKLEIPDREEAVVAVQSGDLRTIERMHWRELRDAGPFRLGERALIRHWWVLAHDRGGYS
jgi:hypothetical protein